MPGYNNEEESAGRYPYSNYYGFPYRCNLFGSLPDYDFESDLTDTDDEYNYPETPVDGMWSGFTPRPVGNSIVFETEEYEEIYEADADVSTSLEHGLYETSAATSRCGTPKMMSKSTEGIENEIEGNSTAISTELEDIGYESGDEQLETVNQLDQTEEVSDKAVALEAQSFLEETDTVEEVTKVLTLTSSTVPHLTAIYIAEKPSQSDQARKLQTKSRLSPIVTRFREPRRRQRFGGRVPFRDLIYGRHVPGVIPVVSAVSHAIDVALSHISTKKTQKGVDHCSIIIDVQHPSYTVALAASQLALAREATPNMNSNLSSRPTQTKSYREKRAGLLGLAGDLIESASRRI